MELETLIPVRKIGGGSITEVFQVQDPETGDFFALKLPREDQPEFWNLASQFLHREATAHSLLRKSQCPYFQRLKGDGTNQTPCHLLLEWVPGKTLQSELSQKGMLGVTDCVATGRQIAQALATLHQVGLAHGDVHPDNILLGEDGTGRLIDLGCAHGLQNDFPECEGLLVGSADYWSPEACLSHGFSGPEADVFALGVVLWESLMGARPWPSGQDLRETIRRRHGDPPAPIPENRRDIPNGLKRLLERMLSRKMSNRPKSRMVVGELIRIELQLMAGKDQSAQRWAA